MFRSLALVASIGYAAAGTILWDGRFNDLTSSTDLNKWSWSNQVGPYQYYIHGSSAVTAYVNLSPSYKNPADSSSKQGVKITLDSTAYWNGQNMRRTELIPQTSAPIASGTVYYHFSMKRTSTNPPNIYREHQINFFESHFTEMKAGWINGEAGVSDPLLRWCVSGVTKWSINWDPEVWHNVAYGINFSAGTVAFYHSTGSNPLTLTVTPVSASTFSNGVDWHLGVLELPVSGQTDSTEDYYFSGVYVESGSLTTSITGPDGLPISSNPAPTPTARTTTKSMMKPTSTTKAASSTMPVSITSSAPAATSSAAGEGGTVAKWGQCGGISYSGPKKCVAGTTCTVINPYYYQCL